VKVEVLGGIAVAVMGILVEVEVGVGFLGERDLVGVEIMGIDVEYGSLV